MRTTCIKFNKLNLHIFLRERDGDLLTEAQISDSQRLWSHNCVYLQFVSYKRYRLDEPAVSQQFAD